MPLINIPHDIPATSTAPIPNWANVNEDWHVITSDEIDNLTRGLDPIWAIAPAFSVAGNPRIRELAGKSIEPGTGIIAKLQPKYHFAEDRCNLWLCLNILLVCETPSSRVNWIKTKWVTESQDGLAQINALVDEIFAMDPPDDVVRHLWTMDRDEKLDIESIKAYHRREGILDTANVPS